MVNNSLLQKILFALVVKRRWHVHGQSLEYSSMNPRESQLADFCEGYSIQMSEKRHEKTHVQQIPYECPNHRMTTDLYKQITY